MRIAGSIVAGTPLLLPSYSSRALSGSARNLEDAKGTVRRTLGLLVGHVLISAYDLDAGVFGEAKNRLGRAVTESPLTFIDSGGYENLEDPDARWTPERHARTLRGWPAASQAVMVGFDVPSADVGEQITSAAGLLGKRRIGRELLLKPVARKDRAEPGGILDLIEQLRSHEVSLRGIDVVGVTEKEAGGTLRERLETVATLRRVLDRTDAAKPIHVFGGLDPILTPLYFLAGADVFDGLSWLRYAYVEGQAHYLQPAAALAHPDVHVEEAAWLVRKANFTEIGLLETELKRLIMDGTSGREHRNSDKWLARAAALGVPGI